MKKLAFVLGYAGSILALVFSMLMILSVPLKLAEGVRQDIADEDIESAHVLAINDMALEMADQGWSDYSERGLEKLAMQTAEKSNADEGVYAEAAKYMYKTGLGAMIAMIVVGASVVLAILALVGSMIVKKAPTAGGVLLLVAAFFLLLASIYTDTLVPMFIATVVLALGGIAVFIPAPAARPAAEKVRAPRPQRTPPQRAPQYGAPQYGAPQYPPQGMPQYPPQYPQQYAPQAAPEAPRYAPQYPMPGAPQYAPQAAPPAPAAYAPAQEDPAPAAETAPAAEAGLPFPEDKPGEDA